MGTKTLMGDPPPLQRQKHEDWIKLLQFEKLKLFMVSNSILGASNELVELKLSILKVKIITFILFDENFHKCGLFDKLLNY